MTKNQIKTSLTMMGYNTDTRISLNKVRIIFLDQDIMIYNNARKYRFRFNTSNNLLEIATGYVDTDGIFKTYSGTSGSNLVADAFYDFNVIAGMIQTEGFQFNHYATVQFGNHIG